MRKFWIEAGKDSPSVFFDESKRLVEIKGVSTVKDAHWFYSNMLKWMIAFNAGSSRTETVNISLHRINDHNTKWLTLIFNKFNALYPDSQLIINWQNGLGNTRLRECCEMLKSQTGFRINIP